MSRWCPGGNPLVSTENWRSLKTISCNRFCVFTQPRPLAALQFHDIRARRRSAFRISCRSNSPQSDNTFAVVDEPLPPRSETKPRINCQLQQFSLPTQSRIVSASAFRYRTCAFLRHHRRCRLTHSCGPGFFRRPVISR